MMLLGKKKKGKWTFKQNVDELTDEELARIGPVEFAEPFNGDPTVIIEFPFVNNVGRFFTVFRNYVVGGEITRGSPQLL